MSDKNNIKDFISSLQDNKKTLKIKCNASDDVYVEPISFGQQKDVLSATLAGLSSITKIMLSMDNIVKENASKPLSILDRTPALIGMKILEMGSEYLIGGTEISLEKLQDNFKEFEHKGDSVIDFDGFSVHMRVPSIDVDIRYLRHAMREYDTVTENEFGKIADIILSYEFPKFIEKFVFNGEDIVLDELPIASTMKILSNLNSDVIDSMQNYIEVVRDYEISLLTVDSVEIELETLFFDAKDDSSS